MIQFPDVPFHLYKPQRTSHLQRSNRHLLGCRLHFGPRHWRWFLRELGHLALGFLYQPPTCSGLCPHLPISPPPASTSTRYPVAYKDGRCRLGRSLSQCRHLCFTSSCSYLFGVQMGVERSRSNHPVGLFWSICRCVRSSIDLQHFYDPKKSSFSSPVPKEPYDDPSLLCDRMFRYGSRHLGIRK